MMINGRFYSEPELNQYLNDYARENKRLADKVDELNDILREVQPVLRAAFFAHFEQTNKANELYDKIAKIVGKE